MRRMQYQLPAAAVAAACVVLIVGCAAESSNPSAQTANHPAGSSSQHSSKESPDQLVLPKGTVVEPNDQPYPELTNSDDQEWISDNDKAWVRLSDEPARHMQMAREAFEHGDRRVAANDLQRAAAEMLLETNRATPQIAEGLRGSAYDLDWLAGQVRRGKVESVRDLDQELSRAAHILARHYTQLAHVAVKEKHPQQAGRYLKSAANYLQKLKRSAESFVDAQLPQSMEDLSRETTLVAGKLIEGAGYTADEASKAVEKVSTKVERLGEKLTLAASKARPPARKLIKGVCVLHPIGDSGVSGTVTFLQRGGEVEITAKLTGLKPGPHGFHIHQYGDCSALDGSSAGGHYNPTAMPHAGPDSPQRHVGDLGNIAADQSGNAEYKRTDAVIQLRGENSIIGRAIIVHAGPDDLKSQPSGNAGARVACGVIGISKVQP